MANRVQPLEELIYCKLPEGMDGYGGYKADILVDNLSEREINLFVCRVCNGIKREACFWEHRERPDIDLPNEEIKKEIDRIKVSCPVKLQQGDCEWTGKLSEFRVHVGACYGHVETIGKNNNGKVNSLLFIFYLCKFLLPCLCSILFLFLFVSLGIGHDSLAGMIHDSSLDISAHSIQIDTLNVKVNQLQHELNLLKAQIHSFGEAVSQKKPFEEALKTLDSLKVAVDEIRLNPYMPQKGVKWTIFEINSIFSSPTERNGPMFYVNQYKFQPMVETFRDKKRCLTFCIALVKCEHYNTVKWPIELEDRMFQVSIESTGKPNSVKLTLEIDSDTIDLFEKPVNEKNDPLCKEWVCKRELDKIVKLDKLDLVVLNTDKSS